MPAFEDYIEGAPSATLTDGTAKFAMLDTDGTIAEATLTNVAAAPAFAALFAPLASSRIIVGAAAMGSLSGTPSLSTVGGGRVAAWLLDAASSEIVGGAVRIPPGWTTFDLKLHWTNAGAGSGNVVFTGVHTSPADGATLATSTGSANSTIAAPAQDVLKVSTLLSGATVAGAIQTVRVVRVGADAADTLANDIGVIALEVVRAS